MQSSTQKMKKIGNSIFNREKMLTIFGLHFEIEERCKGVHCVDLGESFPTSIYLQKSASIQPRTSPSKFGEKFNSLFTSLLSQDLLAGTGSFGAERKGRRRHVPSACPARHEILSIIRQTSSRFRLYRHRSLKVNTCFSALFEIYRLI